jgi:hypothetical protein
LAKCGKYGKLKRHLIKVTPTKVMIKTAEVSFNGTLVTSAVYLFIGFKNFNQASLRKQLAMINQALLTPAA